MKNKKILTVDDVSEQLGHHSNTIRKLLKSGELVGFKSSGEWRVLAEELDAYIQRNTHKPGGKTK